MIATVLGRRDHRRLHRHWKPDDELAASAVSLASRFDRTAVHLHEPPDKRQTDAETTLCVVERSIELREHVEDRIELLRRDADAVVRDGDDRLRAVANGIDPDLSAGSRVLDAVVEQIAEHLREPRRIRV